jgi:hypothetical protein
MEKLFSSKNLIILLVFLMTLFLINQLWRYLTLVHPTPIRISVARTPLSAPFYIAN